MTKNNTPYDIVIHNGTVITMNPDFDVLDKGLIGISNGVIKDVAPQKDVVSLPEAQQRIDARFINPESVLAASLLSCAEMILSGTTCLCDGYFFATRPIPVRNKH